jgi:large subunit ribosomal protein L22
VSIRNSAVPARIAYARKAKKLTVVSEATLRHLRSSAQKTRLVVDQIRGRRVDEARAVLQASRKAVARDLLKLLLSAVANTENRQDLMAMLDADQLVVTRAEVGDGPVLKRIQPAPMGRAYPIRKRSCHVTLELGGIPPTGGAATGKAASGKRSRAQKK